MLISLEEAKQIITPEIATGLALCSDKSFKDWFSEVTDKARTICTPTTKASFINDHMVGYAKQIFPPDNKIGVEIIKVNNREQLVIKDKIRIKLKKFNRNMKSANVITKAVFCYNNQLVPPPLNSQFAMFPMPDDVAHLMSGYLEDSLKIGMKPCIVCTNGNRNHWIWWLDFTMIPTEASTMFPNTGDGSYGLNPKRVTPKEPHPDMTSEMKGVEINEGSKPVQSRNVDIG